VDVICGDCGLAVHGKVRRGRCESCYRRHLRSLKGSGAFAPVSRSEYAPRRKTAPLLSAADLFSNVTPGWGGCWIYTGTISDQGYGRARIGGSRVLAHRAAYSLTYGPIPDGLQIDHTCHTESTDCPGGPTCIHRRCFNPSHLEAVTPRENALRSLGYAAVNALKTHCVHGHEFTPENVLWRRRSNAPHRIWRQCRICLRDTKRKYRWSKAQIRSGGGKR
jgi:hypothetical protein